MTHKISGIQFMYTRRISKWRIKLKNEIEMAAEKETLVFHSWRSSKGKQRDSLKKWKESESAVLVSFRLWLELICGGRKRQQDRFHNNHKSLHSVWSTWYVVLCLQHSYYMHLICVSDVFIIEDEYRGKCDTRFSN